MVYAYDAASQLTSLTYKKGATVLRELTYTYDAGGNRIKVGGAFGRTTIPPALSPLKIIPRLGGTGAGKSRSSIRFTRGLAERPAGRPPSL